MAKTQAAAFTQSRPWGEQEFTSLLQYPGTIALGNEPCFALIRVTLDEAELLTIATHPNHQRQGLARALMVRWHAVAHARGAKRALLEVADDNTPALSLYRALGYEICGIRTGYYKRTGGKPADALVMAHDLP